MYVEHKQPTPFHFTYINEKGEDVIIDFVFDKKNKKLLIVAEKVKQNIFKRIIDEIIKRI